MTGCCQLLIHRQRCWIKRSIKMKALLKRTTAATLLLMHSGGCLRRQHMGSRYIEVFKGHPTDMQGALLMVGRGGTTGNVSGSPVGMGIPGMSGSSDMRYTGVVRMRGMPYSCTAADITAFFKGMEIAHDGIFLCTHADGRPTGEIPGMMGAFGLQSLAGLNLAAIQAAGLGGFSGMHGLGDFSEQVFIKMRGLPYNAGVRDIMEFFEGYNIVSNGVHIITGATDRPTGEAFVEFASQEEAQRAMERHRRNMGSRYIELFRATKSEMLFATGGLSSFNMMHAFDPSMQLLLLQQQAAAGAFGMPGVRGTQGAGAWAEMQNAAAAAASFYQRQAGFAGSAGNVAFDPSAPGKLKRMSYRTLT